MLLHVAVSIQLKMMLLAFKAINGTTPVYLQTLVRPHAPVQAQLASWYGHCWEQTKPAKRSHGSSLFWHLSGGANSRPMSGQWNHSPSSAKDSRLICSDFSSKKVCLFHQLCETFTYFLTSMINLCVIIEVCQTEYLSPIFIMFHRHLQTPFLSFTCTHTNISYPYKLSSNAWIVEGWESHFSRHPSEVDMRRNL